MNTVICAVPTEAISAAEIAAVSFTLLLNVVVRSLPFQRTTELVTKPEPLTVRLKASPPAVPLAGESDAMAGTGLLTVKDCGSVVPPAGVGFTTVT